MKSHLPWPVLLVVTLALLPVGCGPGTPPPLEPLRVGASWTYRSTKTNPGGEAAERMVTFSIAEEREVEGRRWFRFTATPKGDLADWWESLDDQGLRMIQSNELDLSASRLHVKYPAPQGYTFTRESEPGVFTTTTILETAAEITVPAGTFACVKVEHLDILPGRVDHARVEFWHPGTGLVRVDYFKVQMGMRMLDSRDELAGFSR